MKSTVKVVAVPYGNGLKSAVKFVRPTSIIHQSDQEIIEGEDPRDDLINQFLRNPCNVTDNNWFEMGTSHPVPFGHQNPTHWVTTILPIDEKDLFYRFKHAILGRMVPYEDIVKINRGEVPAADAAKENVSPAERIDLSVEKHAKITEFFKWLEETEWASWEEQQLGEPDGRPRN